MKYHYPQFLCNSCDLQMKLFKKLKDKAIKTLEYLQNLYKDEEIVYEAKSDIISEALEAIEHYPNEPSPEAIDEHFPIPEEQVEELEQEQEPTSQIIKQEEEQQAEELDDQIEEFMQTYRTEQNFVVLPLEEKARGEEIYNQNHVVTFDDEENSKTSQTTHLENHQQSAADINFDNTYGEDEPFQNNDSTSATDFFKIRPDSQNSSVMAKSDYVTEIYELMDDNSKTEQYSETSEHLQELDDYDETKAESSIAFSDIEYVESIGMASENEDEMLELNTPKKRIRNNSRKTTNTTVGTPRRREYKCGPCNQEFKTSQEYKTHRNLVHDQKYPCSICSKLLKSQAALYAHMRRHNSPHTFQCDLCQKTFNQKVHLQYHMNHHNNIRNFKCDVCDKAFLTKTDLNIHKRFHTGHRPYVCDICGKSYLMMEHLKAHALIHTEQVFECEVCQRKFSTHKTLRQHVKTIHAEEPQFKCDICLKPFRRKHHLEYHARQHQKGISLLDCHYKLVDEHEGLDNEVENYDVSDDIIDQDGYVEEPGYVVLSDDVIM